MIHAFFACLITSWAWPCLYQPLPLRDAVLVLEQRPRRPGGPVILVCLALLAGCAPSTFTKAVRYSAKIQNELCAATGASLLAMARAEPARLDELEAFNDRLDASCAVARRAHKDLEEAARGIAAVARVAQ